MSTLNQFSQGLQSASQVIDAYRRATEQQLGIDPTEANILRFIQTKGPGRMKDIGIGLFLKLSNLTNIIDRLEDAKLVRRNDSKTDRRAVVVELTSKGTKTLESYDEMFQRLATQAAGQVSAEVLAAAAACLEVIGTMEFQADEA